MERHAAIDRAHEAQIARVAQQGDAARCGEAIQQAGDGRFRRVVIDDDDLKILVERRGQDRLQAGLRGRQIGIDGNDDVDAWRPARCGSGRQRRRPQLLQRLRSPSLGSRCGPGCLDGM